jgi:hypothetical protein
MTVSPDIGECIREGWSLYRRRPLLLSGATLLAVVVNAVAGLVPFATLLTYPPLLGGMYCLLMRLERGDSVAIGNLLDALPRFVPLVIASVLVSLLITLGIFLLILPGLYLALAYGFTTLNIVDRGDDFWPAMERSRKTVTAHFWSYTGLVLVLLLLVFVASIPFGLGLPIALPVALAAQYCFYRRVQVTPPETIIE